MDKDKLSPLQQRVLDLFLKVGVGVPLTLSEIKKRLGYKQHEQSELNRRIREMKPLGWHITHDKKLKGYVLQSAAKQEVKVVDDRRIPGTMRARVLHVANGRCGMCGKHTTEDGIKLAVDHRVPYSWGGATTDENLWALCYECNIQKKDFFASLDQEIMSKCMNFPETQKRLGELLKAFKGKIVPRSLLEVVGRDDEWTRRLRDLRSLGWDVERVIDPEQEGRYKHAYKLNKSAPWPPSISIALKQAGAKGKKSKKSRPQPEEEED